MLVDYLSFSDRLFNQFVVFWRVVWRQLRNVLVPHKLQFYRLVFHLKRHGQMITCERHVWLIVTWSNINDVILRHHHQNQSKQEIKYLERGPLTCQSQSRERVDGSWVMGQTGHENRMGHTGHGSLGVDPRPFSFFLALWLGLYIVAMKIYRVSLWCMCNCACDWRSSKFTSTFKFMLIGLPRVPGYPGTRRVPG